MSETYQEYVVEIPDRGYVNTWTAFGDCLTKEAPSADTWPGHLSHARAADALESIKQAYERMGCPEVAATARIVERTVTVERTYWSVRVSIPTGRL